MTDKSTSIKDTEAFWEWLRDRSRQNAEDKAQQPLYLELPMDPPPVPRNKSEQEESKDEERGVAIIDYGMD